jgi:N-acetylneuraminic acid mutarotase
VVNSRIYVIGGGETAEDRVTMYDPDEDEWSTNLAPLPRPVTRASSIVANNKIYVFGGEDASGNELDSVYEYTPSTNTWRTVKRLPAARSGAAAAVLSSRVYVVGGKNSSGTTTNTLFRGTL